jgi:hypothetical protein
MPEDKKTEKPQMTVRLAPETLAGLKQLIAIDHLTMSAHVQIALNEYLEKKLPPSKKALQALSHEGHSC